MKRLITLGLASAFALSFGAACRTQHLGPNTGASYRAAFEAQRSAEPTAGDMAMNADDAHAVLRVHNAVEGQKGSSGASVSTANAPSIGNTTTTSAGGSGQWQGASGNIQLEAK